VARCNGGRKPSGAAANNEQVSGLQNQQTADGATAFRPRLLSCAKQSVA
jgi:hypothetical protein